MKKKFSPYIKYIVLVLAVVLIAAGVMRGENKIILTKAINICLECIGVG